MTIEQAKAELMQIYGALSPSKQQAIDTLVKIEPCEDTISKSSTLTTIIKKLGIKSEDYLLTAERIVYDIVKYMPPVRPQPKTGHWVEENINEYSRKVVCSECGCPPPFEHVSNGDVYSANGHGVFNKTKYCPNCGARMEIEDNG